jgi:L-2-hydroxycarboxylate dehydrogenase (NAD+)
VSAQLYCFDADILYQFVEQVFIRLNVSSEDAKIAADVLIEAELRGFNCHGLGRLFPCFKRLQKGLINPRPHIEINWLRETTGICDGGNGLGMVIGHRAMSACIQSAKQFGTAFLTAKKSDHFGIAGYYSSMALEHDMIGIAMTNASPRVVPTGGTTGKIGTNPLSVAIPRKEGIPFILDMSTSVVSSGRIDVLLRKGEKVPDGWIYPLTKPFLDEYGVAPMAVLQLPLGGTKETSGYKGYGLGLLVDILCGVLSGANFGSRLVSVKSPIKEANIGHFFGAIQLEGFRDLSSIFKDFEALTQDVKSSPLETIVDKIYIPGEPEFEAKEFHKKNGISVLPPVLDKLRQIGEELEIDISFL